MERTWPKAGASAGWRAAAAAHFHHQLPDARGHRGIFAAARNNYIIPARCCFRRAAIGLRLIPMVRDLRFLWEEMPQQMLDEQAQKVRDSLRAALKTGRAGRRRRRLHRQRPAQCLHPVGHWFEFPTCCATACWRGCWPSARS
jgi:hypothetical protein